MSKIAHVLAVDGGGSKTAAALLTAGGAELARCRVGPANLYRDPAAGLAEITAGLGTALPSGGPAARTDRGDDGDQRRPGRCQRRARSARHLQRHSRALPPDASPATATPPFSACSATTRAPCSRSAPASSPIAAKPGGAPAIRSGWGFPVADRGSGAWLGLRLATEYLDHLDGAATVPASSLWAAAAATFGAERDGILGWLAAARAADFAALAPAVVAAATADDPLGMALLDEGACHLRRLADALAPAADAPLCLGGGLAEIYRPRLEAALPGVVLPPTARPDPLRGAWLVATGAVPPEYPDVA